MGAKNFYFIVVSFILCISLVSALPLPHQFYGSVKVNGQPAPDNSVITATIDGDEYSALILDGNYGYVPHVLVIDDFEEERAGEMANVKALKLA
jgi:hypothetical protein